jgi:uncharacterized protein (TIGR02145 family)
MKTKNKILLFSALVFFILYLLTSCKEDEETTPVIIDDNYGTPCDGMATIEYGGQTYNTVKIGDQCWMRENLNIGAMIQSSDTLKNNDTIEKYCYNNQAANCEIYGGMYNWNELMNYNDSVTQGICPDGWHIPNDADWNILEGTLDSLYSAGDTIWDTIGWRGYNAGGIMKKMGSEDWYYPNAGAENTYGFSAVPGGIRYFEEKTFDKILAANYLWSSTRFGNSDAWFRLLSYGHKDTKRNHTHIENAFSVRCIKNQ